MPRVPLPVVLLLSLAAIGVPWWLGTRHMDFMTPPDEAELTEIREKTKMSVPGRAQLFSSAARDSREDQPVIPEPIRKAPAISPGDPTAPADLADYSEHAEKGAAAFIELAVWLEEHGYGTRALLAWERVLDHCRPDEDQFGAALKGIDRLRAGAPLWNIDPQAAIPLRLEIAVPGTAATAALREQADGIARELGELTSGLLAFEAHVAAHPKGDPSKGLSLRIVNSADPTLSTGTFQLEQVPESAEGLAYHLFSGVFKLAAAQIAATTDFQPPVPPPDGDDTRQALLLRVTRLIWSEFGKSLMPGNSH